MKIFITADNHIGKHLKKRKALRDWAINNFKLIPSKIPNDINYVIFAGDVFDKENTDIECYNAYIEVLSKINSMPNIKNIFVITGNHDQYSNFYNSASIDVVKNIGNSKVVLCNKDYLVWNNDEDNLMITLLPFNRELFLDNEVGTKVLLDKLNEIQFNNSNDCFKILVSHFAITDWMPFATTGLSLNELVGNHYYNLIVMGDLHNEDYEKVDEETTVLYTGSTFHTSISDLSNHNNVCKIITVEDNSVMNIEKVMLPKPPVVKIDRDNLDSLKDSLDENTIVITDDMDIHNDIKDRVLYSQYSPKLEVTNNVTDDSVTTNDDEAIDITNICIDKINNDSTINNDTKSYLINLLNIDTDSMVSSDILEKVKEVTLGDLA